MTRKKRKAKKIKSRLSGLDINEVAWLDYLTELLFLGSICDRHAGLECLNVFEGMQNAFRQIGMGGFNGSVTAWNDFAHGNLDKVPLIVERLPDFFAGATLSLFRRVPLEARESVLSIAREPDPGEEPDWRSIARLVAAMYDARGTLATRVKALHLWIILSNGNNQNAPSWPRQRDEIRSYLAASLPENAGTIRANWLALAPYRLAPSPQWAAQFWSLGMKNTPCVLDQYVPPPSPFWPEETLKPLASELDSQILSFLSGFGPSEIYLAHEVIAGLLARIRQMMSFVLCAVARDEGEAAEVFLRCLADTNITIRWLLKRDDPSLYQRFHQHSHEHEKLAIETVRRGLERSGAPQDWREAVGQEYGRLHAQSGRWPEVMDVTLGPWNETSISAMARELGGQEEEKYITIFGRASDAIHGTWRNLTKFHLTRCLNPLHLGHHLPVAGPPRSAGLTPAFGALLLASEAFASAVVSLADHSEEARKAVQTHREILRWGADHFDALSGGWTISGNKAPR